MAIVVLAFVFMWAIAIMPPVRPELLFAACAVTLVLAYVFIGLRKE